MRRALLLVLSLAIPLTASAESRGRAHPAKKPAATMKLPSVPLFGAHVNESLAWKPRDDRGRSRREADRALELLLRCRQNGAHRRMNPRLGEAIYEIGRHFAGHRIEIFSGYRPRAYCDRAHSRHMTGGAIDFHVEGVPNEQLVAYLRKAFHPAGIGFYPNGVHVHLDVDRPDDTYWVEANEPRDAAVAQADPAPEVVGLPALDTAPETDEEATEVIVLPAAPLPTLPDPPDDDPALDAP